MLSDRVDYEFARDFVARHALDAAGKCGAVFAGFQQGGQGRARCSHCLLDPRELAEWMLADGVPARLGLQIHKFIWDPAMKGV